MKIASLNSNIKVSNIKKSSKPSFLDYPKDTFELRGCNLCFKGVKKSFFEKIGLINSSKDLATKIIQEEYEKLSQEMEQDFKNKGLAFQKPKLNFKKLPKNINANYQMWDNSIVLNSDNLIMENWYKTLNSANLFCCLNPRETGSKIDLEYITSDEYRLIVNSTLAHELQHAKQIQTALHSKEAKKCFIRCFQLRYKLSEDEIKRLFPFVFDFEPKKETEADGKFVLQNKGLKLDGVSFDDKNWVELNDGGHALIFDAYKIFDFMIENSEDYEKYLMALTELDALIAEYFTVANSEFERIDENTIKKFAIAKRRKIEKTIELINVNCR